MISALAPSGWSPRLQTHTHSQTGQSAASPTETCQALAASSCTTPARGLSPLTECVGDEKPGRGEGRGSREAGLERGAEATFALVERGSPCFIAHATPRCHPTRQRAAVTLPLTAQEAQHRGLKIAQQGQARDGLMCTGVARQTVPPGHISVSHPAIVLPAARRNELRGSGFSPSVCLLPLVLLTFSQLVLVGRGGKRRGRIFKQILMQDRDGDLKIDTFKMNRKACRQTWPFSLVPSCDFMLS